MCIFKNLKKFLKKQVANLYLALKKKKIVGSKVFTFKKNCNIWLLSFWLYTVDTQNNETTSKKLLFLHMLMLTITLLFVTIWWNWKTKENLNL